MSSVGDSAMPPATSSPDIRAVARAFQQATVSSALWQIATTIVPLVCAIAAMHAGLALGWWWVVPLLALPAAGLTVRSFIIQHDCGHGSFLPWRRTNDLLGRICGVLTLTPYAFWQRQHAQHHGSWNNLDLRKGRGDDIYSTCLTVAEFQALSHRAQRLHRFVRHPSVALILLPPVIFIILHRIPTGTKAGWRRERRSVHLTNLALLILHGGLGAALGVVPTALVLAAVMVPASIIGVWLFSLQHHFEGTRWSRQEEWNLVSAAIDGSSFLRLPRVLQWFSGSIGFHHVHHLAPRIPNYRLEACHRAHPDFARARVLGIRDGLRAARHALWDEAGGRMVTFAAAAREARAHDNSAASNTGARGSAGSASSARAG